MPVAAPHSVNLLLSFKATTPAPPCENFLARGNSGVATTEHTINDALASVLKLGRHAWRESGIVRSENTGLLKGGNARPDIMVLEPDVSPVAIETEVVPAQTVEPEARSRLGESLRKNGRLILSSIAVKLPKRFRSFSNGQLRSQLLTATDLEMAMFTGSSPDTAKRWPHNQWITGTVADLSILTQAASVPPEIVDQAADQLIDGIQEAAGLFADVAVKHAGAIQKISDELRQENGEQTWRMACAILANAFVFHESLAGGPGDLSKINSLEELRSKGDLTKAGIADEWRKVLEVNYWSIFDIARRILEHVPSIISNGVIETLERTAAKLLANRLMRSHDLTGAVFQKLIADRKFLAAYYTMPSSAALLAGLAIREDRSPAGTPWKNTVALKQMRVADFACGTGTLLGAAYQRIGQLHELAGGDASELHSYMMGGSLVGCDVLPAAAHLTAATLASVHPTQRYTESSILTLAYGRQTGGGIALGSWDLLDAQRKFEILGITARAAQGTGEVTKETWSSLPHYGFDLVIMNPPFTRPTGHEGEKIGIRNPMFAAFQADNAAQKLMAKAAVRLSDGTSYHGNAGEGSIFLVLADRKLKQGGTLAMVLPLSFMLGDAWEKSRALVTSRYCDLILVTNAGLHGSDVSFSSDTGMGECLLVGRKNSNGSKRATFVTLNERPDSTMSGNNIAAQIQRAISQKRLRKLEDGPAGGTPILLGNEMVGQAIDAPTRGGWYLARVRDFGLAQCAYQLVRGDLWLPGTAKSATFQLPITPIKNLGLAGPYHADINGRTSGGGIRGPFDIRPLQAKSTPTFPILWAHEAEREYSIEFDADCEAVPTKGRDSDQQASIDEKVQTVWKTASHCHFNVNFQFNSQATSMQFTARPTLGGRAWLSVKLKSEDKERALVLWANTSLGLLLHWWTSNRQQIGRGNIGKSVLVNLPVLDVDKLTPQQIKIVRNIFQKFAKQPMRPIHELPDDAVRRELDRAILVELLGLPEELHIEDGPLEVLRMKLAQEPSVIGHKAAN